MKSFRKFNSSSSSPQTTIKNPGVKAWINGQSLVSTGLKQLDEIFGGGYALGTFICIEEDELTYYAQTILYYSISESLSQNQNTIIICSSDKDTTNILNHLPFNLSRCDVTASGDSRNSVENPDVLTNHLKIAWQYGKYITSAGKCRSESSGTELPQQQSAPATVYCHSYDLSRRLQEHLRSRDNLQVMLALDNNILGSSGLGQQLSQLVAAVAGLVQASPTVVHRVYVPQLFGVAELCDLSDEKSVRAVTFAVLSLKHIIRSSQSTLIVTLPSAFLPSKLSNNVVAISDTMISITSFAGKSKEIPAEFKEFCGFLSVKKVQQIGAVVPHRPPYDRYGLKRDRRKLHIEPLHLPPEESRATTTDAERLRGAGGLPCAVSLSGSGSLEF